MSGEASICNETCYGRTRNGICEENGACGNENFCYQDDELVFASCDPGTDCADCQRFLVPVMIKVEQIIYYTQPSPSSLNVRTETFLELTRPATNIETVCESQGVRVPGVGD